jgi:putative membrane protein
MTGAASLWMPYCGVAPLPAELWQRWNLDPALIVGLVAAALAYARLAPATAVQRRFWTAWGLAALLFVSPLCALSSALFSVRVVHHALLVAVIAPLLAGSSGDRLKLPGSLALWTGLHALVLWFWHAPQIYGWALSSDLAFWTMQLSLLASAVGFWTAVRRAPEPSAVTMLLLTMIQMGLLGALITFAGAPLYAPHLLSTAAWGYSPLEDQQLAGIIMWAPASALYLGAALFLLGRWFARAERADAARC